MGLAEGCHMQALLAHTTVWCWQSQGLPMRATTYEWTPNSMDKRPLISCHSFFHWQSESTRTLTRTVCTHLYSRHKWQFTSLGVLNPRPTFLTKRVSFFTCPRITFFEFWKTPRCFWYAFSFCEHGGDSFVSKGTDTQTSLTLTSVHVS